MQDLTFRGPCIVIYSYNKTDKMHSKTCMTYTIAVCTVLKLLVMDRETFRNL